MILAWSLMPLIKTLSTTLNTMCSRCTRLKRQNKKTKMMASYSPLKKKKILCRNLASLKRKRT
jgi:hypothetical protein